MMTAAWRMPNRFGIVEDGYLKIYRYDEKTDKIELKKETALDELE